VGKNAENFRNDVGKIIELQSDFWQWLEFLGLKKRNVSVEGGDLFRDNLRNGYFLCQIVARLWPAQKGFLRSVTKEPASIKECSTNVDLGLTVLRDNWKELPYGGQLLKKISILKPQAPNFEISENKVKNEIKLSGAGKGIMNSSSVIGYLPYSYDQMKSLKES
jgi:hypothetical protein